MANIDNVVKELRFKITYDKDSYSATKKVIQRLQEVGREGIEDNIFSKSKLLRFFDPKWRSLQKDIRSQKEEVARIQGTTLYRQWGADVLAKTVDGAFDLFGDLAKKAWDGIVNIAKDAWKEIAQASIYSTSSRLYSREATDIKLRYGFTGEQAYAYQQAYGSLGLEDIALMTKEQRQYYSDLYGQYRTQYARLQESGTLETVQDIQIELEQFQRDMKFSFMDFMADNQDTIRIALMGIRDLADIAIPAVTGILKAITSIAQFLFGTPTLSPSSIVKEWTGGKSVQNQITINVAGNASDRSIEDMERAIYNTTWSALQ